MVIFGGDQIQLVTHGPPNLVSKTFNSLPAPWALGYPVQKNLGWGASSIIFPSWIVKSLAPPANPSILGKRGHKDFREVAAPGFNELVPIFSCFHRLKYLNLISTPLTLRLGGFSPSVHLFPVRFPGGQDTGLPPWCPECRRMAAQRLHLVPKIARVQPNAETKPAPCHVIPGFITASVFLEANN